MRIPSGNSGKIFQEKPSITVVAEHIQEVVKVADSINSGQLVEVHAELQDIKSVANNMYQVKQVAEVELYVRALATDLNNINMVAIELAEVINVSNNMATLLLLHGRMADLLNIQRSLVNIDTVAKNEEIIYSVYEAIPEIATLVSHMASVILVAEYIPELTKILEHVDSLIYLGLNIEHVINVSENMDTIVEVPNHVIEIKKALEELNKIAFTVIFAEKSAKESAESASKNAAEVAALTKQVEASAKDVSDKHTDVIEAAVQVTKDAEQAKESANSAELDAERAEIAAKMAENNASAIESQIAIVVESAVEAGKSAAKSELSAKKAIEAASSIGNVIHDEGDWNAGTGEYPLVTNPDSSYIWRCTEEGTVNGVKFVVDDFLTYSSKSKEFTRIGGGSGGAGSSFIDELPEGLPWQTAKYEKAGVDKMGMDKGTGTGVAWPNRAESIRYKIDKMGGTIKIIFPIGTATPAAYPGLYFTLNLPTNCKFFDTPYNFELTYTIGGDEPKTKVFATPTSEARGLRIDIPVRLDEMTEMWGQVEWPVLFDGETLEMQQERSPISYRVAPLTGEALFDAVAVLSSPTVTASNLLYRYPDKTEIRLTGSVDCVAGEDGVNFNIALPTAFNLLMTEGTTLFEALFVPKDGDVTPTAMRADFVGGLLGISAQIAAGTAGAFIFNTTLPVVKK